MNDQQKKDYVVELVLAHHAKIQKMLVDVKEGNEISEDEDNALNDELLDDFKTLQEAIVDAGGPHVPLDFGVLSWFAQTTPVEAKQIALEMLE